VVFVHHIIRCVLWTFEREADQPKIALQRRTISGQASILECNC
jgi:hypothetical protein